MDKLRAIISNNKSKRNYGNQVNGPWVFGMVLQEKSTIQKNQNLISSNNKSLIKYARSKYPSDKSKRQTLYKDKRRANTRENRLQNAIDKRKYASNLLKTQLKQKHKFRMFVVQKRDAATLLPLIKKNAIKGSDIHSDEWRA